MRRLSELTSFPNSVPLTALKVKALVLDADKSTATLQKLGMWLDLGGLAKGMIGDEVIRLLKQRGIKSCRYRAGGDMVFGDAPPGQVGWRVTVPEHWIAAGEREAKPLTFTAANSAASVSGDSTVRVSTSNPSCCSSSIGR